LGFFAEKVILMLGQDALGGKVRLSRLSFGLSIFGLLASCWAWADSATVSLVMSQTLSPLMTVIRYEDRDADQTVYLSRIFVLGGLMRMDYGRDDEGFILFDRAANTVWHVSPGDRRLTGIAARVVDDVWPKQWKLIQAVLPSEQGGVNQVRLNGVLCAEFKFAPLLKFEAGLLADFRRALAANQATAWQGTPDDLREPCLLAIDVREAGIEYRQGLPLAIRYWDGRSRVYQGHEKRLARPELFELPKDYLRFVIGGDQGNSTNRQPRSSQVK
jgi:hypothetical protein